MERDIIYWDDAVRRINETDELVIYGAGMMGKALKTCLTDKPYNKSIAVFVVESMEDNPAQIDGIAVVDINHAQKYKNSMILVALHEKHIGKAIMALRKAGFSDILPLSFDSDFWSDIRGNWFRLNKMQDVYGFGRSITAGAYICSPQRT